MSTLLSIKMNFWWKMRDGDIVVRWNFEWFGRPENVPSELSARFRHKERAPQTPQVEVLTFASNLPWVAATVSQYVTYLSPTGLDTLSTLNICGWSKLSSGTSPQLLPIILGDIGRSCRAFEHHHVNSGSSTSVDGKWWWLMNKWMLLFNTTGFSATYQWRSRWRQEVFRKLHMNSKLERK